MLELYAASWLAALGALALPLVLHLFGRGHERRVAVGSVAFLRPAATRRGRRLRPSDWPLLLLRCALLALLALALAEPRWRGRESTPRRPVESRVAPERGENRWLEGARRRRDGGLVVRVGRSSALRTTFESVEVPAGAEAAGIAITPRGDALELRLASGGDETADDALLLSPAPAARVWIRPSPERAAGVEFLRAGGDRAGSRDRERASRR
jgi:hypothetical protein